MFTHMPPLPWLRAFEASARLGNFTRAAEELLLTPSAVSYQVRALEAELGQKLFDRQRRMLVLTRLGQNYLPIVTKAFSVIDTGTVGIFGKHRPATVTLRGLTSFNLLWLLPRLKVFRAAHPEIYLRFLSTSWSDSGGRDPIDIDIRYGDGTWPDGTVIALPKGRVVPVCAPGRQAPATEVLQGPLIEITGAIDTWAQFQQDHLPGQRLPDPVAVVDQSVIALEMAKDGHGYALVADLLAAPFLARGDLVQACEASLPERLSHHLVLPHSGNHHRPEIIAFVSWILAEAGVAAGRAG